MRKSLGNFGEKIHAFFWAGRRRLGRHRMTPPCPAKSGKNAIRHSPWRARESHKSGDRIISKTAFSSPLEFQVARGEVPFCMIRFRVLGVVLVGCKICPSGIPLEDATKHDDQNTTKTTTKTVSILQRHLLLSLEILVERENHENDTPEPRASGGLRASGNRPRSRPPREPAETAMIRSPPS